MKRLRKWDHEYEVGSKEWGRFRAKVLADFEKQKVFVVLKGLSGEELKISGDYETILRKLIEFYEVVDRVFDEVEDLVRGMDPEAYKRIKEWIEKKGSP